MVLKVFSIDGSSKMVAIHNGMNARDVCLLLAERNHLDIGPNWTVVENITDLQLGNGCCIKGGGRMLGRGEGRFGEL